MQIYEDVTGMKYVDGLSGSGAGVGAVHDRVDVARSEFTEDGNEIWKLPQEEVVRLSLKFAAEVHKRGLRVMWDPQNLIEI